MRSAVEGAQNPGGEVQPRPKADHPSTQKAQARDADAGKAALPEGFEECHVVTQFDTWHGLRDDRGETPFSVQVQFASQDFSPEGWRAARAAIAQEADARLAAYLRERFGSEQQPKGWRTVRMRTLYTSTHGLISPDGDFLMELPLSGKVARFDAETFGAAQTRAAGERRKVFAEQAGASAQD